MYNRYIPSGNTYTRVAVEDTPERGRMPERDPVPPPAPPPPEERQQNGPGGQASPDGPKYIRVDQRAQGGGKNSGSFFPGGEVLDSLKLGKLGELLGRDKSGGLNGLLGALGLEDLDSGDVLLLLIILFLLWEGDNLELVITLGLMLLMGLNDKKEKTPDGTQPSGERWSGDP